MRMILPTVLLLCTAGLSAGENLFHLPIGDPARKDRTAPVQLDAITDSSTGELISPRELALRLADTRIVFMGESHTNLEYHRAQLQLIRELHAAGREVLIGLEMFPANEQKHLDFWNDGLVTEKGFVDLSNWYGNWGYNWNYYREIFQFARDNGIRMFAVNAPRAVVTAVRQKGFDGLSEEEKKDLPERIDIDSEDHRRLFKIFLGGGDDDGFHASLSEEQLNGMFNAQCTWDAAMAYNSVRNLKEHGGGNSIMVVLIGFGHVAYGLGIERQAALWFDGKMASVIPLEMADEKGRELDSAQASFASFLWGLPVEEFPAFPELGISTRANEESKELKVIFVQPDSVAERAGVKAGDVLLAMDGETVKGRSTLNRAISGKRWGDAAILKVRRDEQELELQALFRRRSEEDREDADAEEPSHP